MEAALDHLSDCAVHRHPDPKLHWSRVLQRVRAEVAHACPCHMFRRPPDHCSHKVLHVSLCQCKG